MAVNPRPSDNSESPPPVDSTQTASYSSQHASSLFHAFLQQASPSAPPSHLSPAAVSPPSSLSPSSSSSLAHALTPPSSRASTQPAESSAAGGKRVTKSRSPASLSAPESEQDASQSPPAKTSQTRLSSDQPLTAQGKPRERAYLACRQCRNRKVRCDGGKPECYNCCKRADPLAGQCSYDPAPRRRGKDRTPGSRRNAPLEPKKTRTTRSRIEEEERRKKAEAAAAVSASSGATPAPEVNVVHDSSSTNPVQDEWSNAQTPQADIYDSIPTSFLPPLHPDPPDAIPTYPVVYGMDPIEALFHPLDMLYTPPEEMALAARIEEEEDVDGHRAQTNTFFLPPSVQFTRETWWDALLLFYASDPFSDVAYAAVAPTTLTLTQRDAITQHVAEDLRLLFRISLHWFSFINIPRFFATLLDPRRRAGMQPSLVFSALALATFWQSSEVERGAHGRAKAFRLLDRAHAAFQASLNSGWVDVGLVQAAWVPSFLLVPCRPLTCPSSFVQLLAMFEIQAHPRASTARTHSAFRVLDSIIRALALTTLDIGDPHTSTFAPGAVPIVRADNAGYAPPLSFDALAAPLPHEVYGSAPLRGLEPAYPAQPTSLVTLDSHPYSHPHAHAEETGVAWQCECSAYSLGASWPIGTELAPAWTCMPMWPKNGGEGEGALYKEECRRLVWSTVMLTVSHNTKTTAGTGREPQHLWIKDPANYALLFPGESLVPLGTTALQFSKENVWALYMRTLFLWHSSLRACANADMSEGARAQWGINAWLELDRVEAAMDRHTCDIQTGFMMQMREVLFNTRMIVSSEFRRYIPEARTASGALFYRDKTEKWMRWLLNSSARHFLETFHMSKGRPTGHSRRCFLGYWFMSQITRALSLWNADPTLTIALEVAMTFAPCVEYMMMIWPSPDQHKEYERLRGWLVRCCHLAGVPPPARMVSTDMPPPPPPPPGPLPHYAQAVHTPLPGHLAVGVQVVQNFGEPQF